MHSLSKLFLSLAEIYIAENRNGANLSSQALIQASSEINTPKLLQNQFSKEVKSVLTTWRWSGEIGFDRYKLH
ncbi:MAG TPA: hypothetical protein QF725_02380 [Gammaproteobacteria bacterium]|jgi:hypothetical protein|nr:hypothetical protein [Gammaproteobacteria bacterium]|tara:strand:- start:2097 stop:2315 length:219 start_codon:yes stop_codon:yes gene_type:complete